MGWDELRIAKNHEVSHSFRHTDVNRKFKGEYVRQISYYTRLATRTFIVGKRGNRSSNNARRT